MNFPKIEGQMTVKKLREYFDEMEASWTEEDAEILGSFEHQEINTLGKYGISPASVVYSGGHDFIILEVDYVE